MKRQLQRLLGGAALALVSALVLAQAPQTQEDFQPQIGQPGKDVVWVPMPDSQVERMLDLAKVTPQDFVIDLGSGDGRTVIAAARRGARSLGVEFDPKLVEFSRREAAKAGVADRAAFAQGDLFEADLSRATVITLFLLDAINLKLRPMLLGLRPGTRIVSNTFTMGDWDADVLDWHPPGCFNWCQLHLWYVPARVAGAWRAPEGEMKLEQRYQVVTGTLGSGPTAVAISGGKLTGDQIRFTAGGSEYSGRVTDKGIEGTVTTGGALRPWRAEKIAL